MDIQKEPIGHTCPDINKYVRELEKSLNIIKGYHKSEDIDELHNMLSVCESTMNGAIS